MKTKIYEQLSDLFPLWREVSLGEKGHEKKECKFVYDIFKSYPVKIKTVIDLGGSVGTHAGFLLHRGYRVTIFDQSKKALQIAKAKYPNVKVLQGSFET